MPESVFSSAVPASAEELFSWHERPHAFERLNPPWDPVRVVGRAGPPGLERGVELTLEARVGPVPVRWVSRHTACTRPSGFVDAQVRGPFARWRHEHRFEDGRLTDVIDWAAPLGAAGAWVAEANVARRLARAFGYRHRRTADDLGRWRSFGARKLRIALTGATGFVGAEVRSLLDVGGDDVITLSTRTPIPKGALSGVDAVIHLAGEPIAGHRWTEEHKQRVLASRRDGTAAVVEAIRDADPRPPVLVSASAIGWYGDRGDEWLTEPAPRGDGFLAEVCAAWEAATAPARALGVRVVTARIGLVVGAAGGLLPTLLPVYRAGLGGRIGDGEAWQSWIAVDDVAAALVFAVRTPSLDGPVNLVGPEPVRQAAFADALASAVGRWALVPTPRAAVVARLGAEAARELAFASARVRPAALEAAGFTFRYPTLAEALAHQLGTAA